jgi:hypothetical protein
MSNAGHAVVLGHARHAWRLCTTQDQRLRPVAQLDLDRSTIAAFCRHTLPQTRRERAGTWLRHNTPTGPVPTMFVFFKGAGTHWQSQNRALWQTTWNMNKSFMTSRPPGTFRHICKFEVSCKTTCIGLSSNLPYGQAQSQSTGRRKAV